MIINEKQYKVLNAVIEKDFREYLSSFLYDKENQALAVSNGHMMVVIKDKNTEFNKIVFKMLDKNLILKEILSNKNVELNDIPEVNVKVPDFSKQIQNFLKDDRLILNTFNPDYLMKSYKIVKAFISKRMVLPPKCIKMNDIMINYKELDDNKEFYSFIASMVLE